MAEKAVRQHKRGEGHVDNLLECKLKKKTNNKGIVEICHTILDDRLFYLYYVPFQ